MLQISEEEVRRIIREELRNIIREELKEVKQELEGMRQELEKLERQVELQDLSFRALVKATKSRREAEEEYWGTYVRSGRGFNSTHVKYVRDPLI